MEVDAKGKQRRRYRRYQTPLETLLALPKPKQYLHPGVRLASLREIARHMSDTQAARQMQRAKQTLFLEMRRSAWGPWK